MISPVIPKEKAEDLNLQIMRLDRTLFWSCNYTPTLSFSMSNDSLFLSAIQDLYKFSFDTNYVFRFIATTSRTKFPNNVLFESDQDFTRCRKNLRLVEVLRSVIDHNHSDKNGYEWQKRMNEYSLWIESVVRKDQPECDTDFAKLNQELQAIADELVETSRNLITTAINSPKREKIILFLKEQTLRWLCNGTQQQFYLSQLIDSYIERSARAGKGNEVLSKPSHILRLKARSWIREQHAQTLQKHEREIAKLLDSAKTSENILAHPPKFVEDLGKKNPEALERFKANLSIEARDNREQAEKLELEHNKLSELKEKEIVSFFFDTLSDELDKTAHLLDESKISYTYLPQDLMQHDIERRFSAIPSPEKDFS